MREWLDRNRHEPMKFTYDQLGDGVVGLCGLPQAEDAEEFARHSRESASSAGASLESLTLLTKTTDLYLSVSKCKSNAYYMLLQLFTIYWYPIHNGITKRA
jgi:hypothetical protein